MGHSEINHTIYFSEFCTVSRIFAANNAIYRLMTDDCGLATF